MSQPVDFDLNLTGNYVPTMGQAVAVTQQYSDVAEGVRGRVGNLQTSMVGLTSKVGLFSKVNSVAVDQAASYQKVLSNIEATATVTGKSFASLSDSTRKLARDFPIGMQGAVDVVESLQSVGVKSEESISRLGKSFVNLGAATNSNAAQIGRDMTLMSKSMGNGTSQFDALSDSLVSVTKQLGASAPATIAFSKALAPIAATVGIGQTSVMGLSAAMSSLGEDGYRAANTFGKVMLDMKRAIRDGGPELKAYADVMGTTSEKLRDLFNTNPAEMLAQFTESIAKAGPNSQRALEALGFDSVRDTRTLQSLSRSGGLRSAIGTSVAAYGSGSSEKAAEVAMAGVVDQAVTLKETMGQTVANLGKPLLGLASTQLAIANKVAGVFETVTGDPKVQKAGTVAGVAAGVGSMGFQAIQALGLLALGKAGLNAVRSTGIAGAFKEGRLAGVYGQTMPASEGRLAGYGTQAGYRIGQGLAYTNMGTLSEAAQTGKGMVGWGMRASTDIGSRFLTGYYRNIMRMGMGANRIQTPEGAALGRETGAAFRARFGMLREGEVAPTRASLLSAGAAYTRSIGAEGLGTNVRKLGMAATMVGVDSAKFGAGMAARGIGMAGAGMRAMGLTGPTLALAGGVMGGMYLNSRYQENQASEKAVRGSSDDIYSAFNNFKEAAGGAGRGLVAFNAAVQASTMTLVHSNTTMAKALDVSGAESATAGMAGYKRAFTATEGVTDTSAIAAQLTATLGAGASPEDVARGLADVSNQFGKDAAKAVSDAVTPFFTGTARQDFSGLQATVRDSSGFSSWFSPNEEQTKQGQLMLQAGSKTAYEKGLAYGQTKEINGVTISAGMIEQVNQAKILYEDLQKQFKGQMWVGRGERNPAAAALSGLLNATPAQQGHTSIDQGMWTPNRSTPFMNGTPFQSFITDMADAGNDAAKAYLVAQANGMAEGDYSWASGDPDAIKQSKLLARQYEYSIGVTDSFSKTLYEANDAAQKAGTTLAKLPESVREGLSGLPRALAEQAAKPTATSIQQSGQVMAAEALARSGGDTTKAAGLLQANLENAPMGMTELTDALGSAISQLSSGASAMQQAVLGPRGMQNQQMKAGWAAQERAPFISPQMTASNDMSISMGQAAEAGFISDAKGVQLAYGQMQAGIMQASRSAGIQMGAIARDGALKEKWAEEDYLKSRKRARQDNNVQIKQAEHDFAVQKDRMFKEFQRSERYAREDHETTEFRAQRDFDTQMGRAKRDYDKSVERAHRDNNKAIERAERDFKKQTTRAEEDYQKGRGRAVEDYNRSVARANRDFGIQQAQAAEDYNKNRTRMVEDYNKSLKRMIEDSAKSMYDPYKRIAAQMVMDAGQLIANLKDQTDTLNKQVGNLAAARAMGMTDATIKALNLSEASNAQQLQRLVEDGKGNPDLIRQLNAQVSSKASAANGLVTDSGSTQYSRMQEDFTVTQARAAEDYAVATTRANEGFVRAMADGAVDFNVSMARMAEDFALSVTRAQDDFTTSMGDQAFDFTKQLGDMEFEYLKGAKDALENFKTSMNDLDTTYNTSRIRALEQYNTQVDYLEEDHALAMARMAKNFHKQMRRMAEDHKVAIERMRIQTANAISDVGAQLGASIASMKESFNGLMEVAGKTPEQIAQGIVDMFAELGGAKGQAQQQMLQNAKDFLQHQKDITKEKEKQAAIDAAKLNGTFIGPVYDPSYVPRQPPPRRPEESSQVPQGKPRPSMSTYVPDPFDSLTWFEQFDEISDGWTENIEGWFETARLTVGSLASGLAGDLWQGLMDGVGSALSTGWNWLWDRIFGDQFDEVETKLEVNSPSKYMFRLGGYIVQGLIDGVVALAGNIWHWITDPIADMDVMGKVTNAFKATMGFLTNLGTTVGGWVSDGWNSLWKAVEDLDIKEKVVTAFKTAGAWISDIGEWVKEKVSDGWNSLWKKIEDLDIKAKVIAAFVTAGDWIGDIGEWVGGKIGDGWNALWEMLPSMDEMTDKVKGVFGIGNGKNGSNTGVAGFLGNLFETIKDLIAGGPGKSIKERFLGLFSPIGDAFKDAVREIIRVWNSVDFALHIDTKIPGVPTFHSDDIFPDITHIPFAQGGIATGPTNALIAEAGSSEAVIPLNAQGISYLAAAFRQYLQPGSMGGNSLAGPWTSEYRAERELQGAINRVMAMFSPLTNTLPAMMVTAGAEAIASITRGLNSNESLEEGRVSAVAFTDAWLVAALEEFVASEKDTAKGLEGMMSDIIADKDFVVAMGRAGESMTGLISDGMIKDLSVDGATYKAVMAAAVALAQAAAAAAGSGSSSSYSGSGGSSGGSSGGDVHITPQQVGDSITAMTKPWDVSIGKTAIAAAAKPGLMHWDSVKHMLVPGAIGGGPMDAYQARWVGEGGPELFVSGVSGQVVPRGIANLLLSNSEARQSMVAPYSSPVYNTFTSNEDYSTHVTGVTVQAQDPDDFMRQMEARAARSRLSNTVGSR